jgi:hypothetical protein
MTSHQTVHSQIDIRRSHQLYRSASETRTFALISGRREGTRTVA